MIEIVPVPKESGTSATPSVVLVFPKKTLSTERKLINCSDSDLARKK